MITCDDTTTWLLAAEPDELSANGNRDVAEHLVLCAQCRSRVARVVGDTAWLASVLPMVAGSAPHGARYVPPARRAPWRQSAWITVAVLAASLLVVLLPRGERAPIGVDPRQASGVSLARAPGVAPAPARVPEFEPQYASGAQRPLPATSSTAGSADLRRLPAAPVEAPVSLSATFVPPTPVRAVRLDSLFADRAAPDIEARSSAAVDVEPLTERRFAVLQSSPRVTVIWFY